MFEYRIIVINKLLDEHTVESYLSHTLTSVLPCDIQIIYNKEDTISLNWANQRNIDSQSFDCSRDSIHHIMEYATHLILFQDADYSKLLLLAQSYGLTISIHTEGICTR